MCKEDNNNLFIERHHFPQRHRVYWICESFNATILLVSLNGKIYQVFY